MPRLREIVRAVRRCGALMVGIADYETYLAHCRARHPDRAPMDRAAFMRDRLERRYGARDGEIGRCC